MALFFGARQEPKAQTTAILTCQANLPLESMANGNLQSRAHSTTYLVTLAVTLAIASGIRAPVSTTTVYFSWEDFSTEGCAPSSRIAAANGSLTLGQCATVPATDPNPSWRLSSFLFTKCFTASNGSTFVEDHDFKDPHCSTPSFEVANFSVFNRNCTRVPLGPNSSAPYPAVWHTLASVTCVQSYK